MKRRLRIALWLDSYRVAAWFYASIANVKRSHHVEIVLLMVDRERQGAAYASGVSRKNGGWLYRFFRLMDQWLSPRMPDAQEAKDIRELLAVIPIVELDWDELCCSDAYAAMLHENITTYDLDVVIREVLPDDLMGIESTARYGIWGHRFGMSPLQVDGAYGFWEVMLREPVTQSYLVCRAADRKRDTVLYTSASATDHVSVHRSMNRVYWKSSKYASRLLRELYETGEGGLEKRIDLMNGAPAESWGDLRAVPKWYEVLLWVGRLYSWYMMTKALQLLRLEQWFVLYSMADMGGVGTDISQYRKLVPPKDRDWADPFVLEERGVYHVFFEEYLYHRNKGHIAYLTINRDGEATDSVKVLEADCHLSYPFLFRHEGTLYMMPEKGQKRVIDLYRCLEFPHRWERVRTLLSGVKAVDATLLRHNDLWWLFANLAENEGMSTWDELSLYYSTDLLTSDWVPHPRNPVVSDVRSARPAGRIYMDDGHLYRPSQNCSRGYGCGMSINRIETLTTTDYRETRVHKIEPRRTDKIVATHTINRAGAMSVADAKWKRMRFF